jgi:hypothetical protein
LHSNLNAIAFYQIKIPPEEAIEEKDGFALGDGLF